MNLNKICPDCETEYLPNILRCADCGTVLILHEELERILEEKRRLSEEAAERAVEDAVVVREGDLNWMGELYNTLIAAGIPCTVVADAACRPGRCRDNYQLIVSGDDLERAKARIEEYFMEIYPEIRASNELAYQGKCPACGAATRESDRECRDCGLTFVIETDPQSSNTKDYSL